LIAIKDVTDKDGLMIINKSGIIIRLAVAELRVIGRATQGVRLINLKATDEIAAVSKVDMEEVIEEVAGAENGTETDGTEGSSETGASEDTEPGTGVDNKTE
ncbi:MAG: DNA gyrase C-terminal beta-propeller domain-containing protein, partial [Bacteroidota bacterium]|nr:DNA gyrase C-terminal beta-propeller domain-containing protein [Bacteroidota bacterium]